MPEGAQGTGTAEAGQGTSSEEGNQQQQGTQQQESSQDGGRSDDAAAVIARLNREAKQHRERAEAAEARLAEIEQSKLSEQEKVQQALAAEQEKSKTLEQQLRDTLTGSMIRDSAIKAKATDPDLVRAAVDKSAVEYDGDGKPTNLDALIEAVKKAHPVLFKATQGSGDGGSQGGSAPTSDMNELIRRGARRGAPA